MGMNNARIILIAQAAVALGGVGLPSCSMGQEIYGLEQLRKQIGKELASAQSSLPAGLVLRPDEPTELLQRLCTKDKVSARPPSSPCHQGVGSYYLHQDTNNGRTNNGSGRLVIHISSGKIQSIGTIRSAKNEHEVVRMIYQFLKANGQATSTAHDPVNAGGSGLRTVLFDAGTKQLVVRYLWQSRNQQLPTTSSVDVEELYFE